LQGHDPDLPEGRLIVGGHGLRQRLRGARAAGNHVQKLLGVLDPSAGLSGHRPHAGPDPGHAVADAGDPRRDGDP